MNKEEPSLLQKTYLQKSMLFLLPLVGLQRNKYFQITNTYICAPELVSAEYPEGIGFGDEIIILAYSKEYKIKQDNLFNQVASSFKNLSIEETGWDKHESTLISNKRFMALHESEDEYLYTFDMTEWHMDWNFFLKGKYTLMSDKAKRTIRDYKWQALKPIEQKKLHCYLYANEDEKCFEDFAAELKCTVEELRAMTRELCSKPDLRLETYKIPNKKQVNVAEV